jgi:hypothetical protein
MKSIFNTTIYKKFGQQRLVWSLLIISVALLSQSCKKDDPKSESDRVQELLAANTWQLQEVTIDNAEEEVLFAGMTLQFTNTTYTTTNGGVVWPATGTWEFKDASAKTILRSDGLEIAITEITATSLKLSLVWTEDTIGEGRVGSIAGDHVFSFVK